MTKLLRAFLLATLLITTTHTTTSSLLAETSSENSLRELDIQLNVQSGCMLGDFDAIRQDLGFSHNQKIILSVLNLRSGREESFSIFQNIKMLGPRIIPASQQEWDDNTQLLNKLYDQGTSLRIELPTDLLNTPESYLISICKDSQETDSCQNKETKDIMQVIREYSKTDLTDFTAPDRVYFSQILEIKNNQVLPFERTINDQTRSTLATHSSELEAATEELKNAAILKSLPMETTSSGRLKITLPFYDRNKCGQIESMPRS